MQYEDLDDKCRLILSNMRNSPDNTSSVYKVFKYLDDRAFFAKRRADHLQSERDIARNGADREMMFLRHQRKLYGLWMDEHKFCCKQHCCKEKHEK